MLSSTWASRYSSAHLYRSDASSSRVGGLMLLGGWKAGREVMPWTPSGGALRLTSLSSWLR